MSARQCLGLLLLCPAIACTEVHEIDLTRTADFEWDGKVRVTIQSMLVPWPDSDVTSIELSSRDGRVAKIVPAGSDVHATVDLPVRTVDVLFSQPGD